MRTKFAHYEQKSAVKKPRDEPTFKPKINQNALKAKKQQQTSDQPRYKEIIEKGLEYK